MINHKLDMQNDVLLSYSWMNSIVFKTWFYILIAGFWVQFSFIFLKCLFETGNVDQGAQQEFHNNIFIMLTPLGCGGPAVRTWG